MNRITLLQANMTREDLGLEIGPYHNPIFPKKDGWNVRSIDVFTTEELIERGRNDPNIGDKYKNIEAVDYIFRGSLLDSVLDSLTTKEVEDFSSGSGLFDYIVSSHNFEHQPNPILFLVHCAKLLKPGGSLVMAIPTGTRCFDRMRPLSTTGHLIDAYIGNSAKPTPGQILDHRLNMAADITSTVAIHHNSYRSDQLVMLQASTDKMWNPGFYEYLLAAKDSIGYVDSHCWTFNMHSFNLICTDLMMLGILPDLRVSCLLENRNEFIVTLNKIIEAPSSFPNRCSLSADAIHYYGVDIMSLKPMDPAPAPMHPGPLSLQATVKELFSIHQFRLLHHDGDFVACYGEPSSTDNGWIFNLPASHVFEGDYHALPFETDLDAIWVHSQVRVKDPFSVYLCHKSPVIHWATKVANAGVPNYEHADVFRDAAFIFSNAGQYHLALDFIKKAHNLRPKGPAIAKMLDDLQAKCSSDQ